MSDNSTFVSPNGENTPDKGVQQSSGNGEREQLCSQDTTDRTTPSSVVDNSTLDGDFDRLTRSFESIATIPSPARRRYTLARIAPYHGIPRAEARAIFALWQVEKGGQNDA